MEEIRVRTSIRPTFKSELLEIKKLIDTTPFKLKICSKKEFQENYIDILCKWNAIYHFDDDVTDVIWRNITPDKEELELIQELTAKLYDKELFTMALKTMMY